MTRRPIVGVVGSGREAWPQRSRELGVCLATLGVHLLTGGGGGVMSAVSRAFSKTPVRKGMTIGILPCESDAVPFRPKEGYPNAWVEVPIATHLPLSGERGHEVRSRNHIVVLSSDVIVIMPGGPGTVSEALLAVEYQRPVVAYLRHRSEMPDLSPTIPVVSSLDDVEEFVRTALAIEG